MNRRSFVKLAGAVSLGLLGCTPDSPGGTGAGAGAPDRAEKDRPGGLDPIRLFLCGDVMTGRGVDQVLPHSVDPRLHERWVKSALEYVDLAERVNGPIPRPVDFTYIWGDALGVLERSAVEARIINLETAVTDGGEPWPAKGIHYRMHPGNTPCLTAAGIHCCVLANNHALDWGRAGLSETLAVLEASGLRVAGAGHDLTAAESAAVLPVRGDSRVLVFGLGHESSGIPPSWAAGEDQAGVSFIDSFSEENVERLAGRIEALRRPRDLVVVSIHWGGNWGYGVSTEQRTFAHLLIDRAGVDVVHGHSSHHPKGLEVHQDRLILYGCGDFLNDYEGIGGYERYRGDLALMYLPRFDRAGGGLISLEMVPMQVRRFRLHRASEQDSRWLAGTLDRESSRFGCRVEPGAGDSLSLRW